MKHAPQKNHTHQEDVDQQLSWEFGSWLFRGDAAGSSTPKTKPGLLYIFTKYAWIHAGVGIAFALDQTLNLATASQSVLLPVTGSLLGFAFAWGANGQSLLQTKEIQEIQRYGSQGLKIILYKYQLAFLCVLTTVILWGLAGLGVPDRLVSGMSCSRAAMDLAKAIIRGIYFAQLSQSIEAMWGILTIPQAMALTRSTYLANTSLKDKDE
jgi:hypothetical protein